MADREITQLLRAWGTGDRTAGDELFTLVYSELYAVARRHALRDPDATVSPTVLINEAFLHLADAPKTDWRDRVQFFAFTATVMRRLMVTYWRNRTALKRGGEFEAVMFDESIAAMQSNGVLFFGGLSVDETAEYLGISPRTVNRHWGMAKAWLADRLRR